MKYFKVFNKYEKINKKYGRHYFEQIKFARQNRIYDIFHSFNFAKINACQYSNLNINKAKNNGLFDNNDFECRFYFNHFKFSNMHNKVKFVTISKHKSFDNIKLLE